MRHASAEDPKLSNRRIPHAEGYGARGLKPIVEQRFPRIHFCLGLYLGMDETLIPVAYLLPKRATILSM